MVFGLEIGGQRLGRDGPLREAQAVVAAGFCVARGTQRALQLGGNIASSPAPVCISDNRKAFENHPLPPVCQGIL